MGRTVEIYYNTWDKRHNLIVIIAAIPHSSAANLQLHILDGVENLERLS